MQSLVGIKNGAGVDAFTVSLVLLDRRVWDGTGGTWSKPATGAGNILAGTGVLARLVCHGGGGSGGSGGSSFGSIGRGNGGGAGGRSERIINLGQMGSTETVTVGAGGASDTAGGNTTIGSLLTAGGGFPGPPKSASNDLQPGRGGFGNLSCGMNGTAAAGSGGTLSGLGGLGQTGDPGITTTRGSSGNGGAQDAYGSDGQPGFAFIEVWGIAS